MRDLPIRVAVVSSSHVVRAGVVSLIARLEDQALVTEAVSLDEVLGPHDVAIYDLGAGYDIDAHTGLRRLLERGVPVVGLVYDGVRPDTGLSAPVVSLAVAPEELLEVLRQVAPARGRGGGGGLPAGLTEQEFRVVELIGAGLTNEQIARELFVSINSVKTYIRAVYRKLEVENRTGAVLWAVRHGLASGDDARPSDSG